MRPLARGIFAGAVAAWTAAAPAPAQTFLTQDEALALAFPQADSVVRRTAYLDDAQASRVREAAGAGEDTDGRVIPYYLAFESGQPQAVAYFDAHTVRTLPEVLMIVVDPDARIRRIEVVRFSEPRDYLAPGGWLRQFDGRTLDDDLTLKRGIANITGATLTSGAVAAAARRVLALHAVIHPLSKGLS